MIGLIAIAGPNSQYLSYIFLRLRLAQTCRMILYFFMAWFIFLGACSGEPASKWGAKFKKAGRVDGFVPSLLLSDFHIDNQVDAESDEGDTSGNLPVKNTFIHFGSPSRREKIGGGWFAEDLFSIFIFSRMICSFCVPCLVVRTFCYIDKVTVTMIQRYSYNDTDGSYTDRQR